jgi:phosphatidylinositol-3-phosphatase
MRFPGRRAVFVLFALTGWTLPVASAQASRLATHDHVVVVVMENKSYAEVRTQPYTASLIAAGASFSSSYGVTHPSQPNYIALWAGSDLGVGNNNCPAPGSPFTNENFGQACEASGLTWGAYSENLPTAGAAACSYEGSASSGLYTRKHDPWTNFSNLDHANEKPYSQLAADIAAGALPNLVFIVPNNCHNSHNSTTAGCGVPEADAWLASNLPPLLAAMGPAGVLILTWDEDDNSAGNQILTVFVGPRVRADYLSPTPITHYTVVRTITELLGLPSFGQFSMYESPIEDIWTAPIAVRPSRWGSLKAIYR